MIEQIYIQVITNNKMFCLVMSHLLDKHISSPMNLLYDFDDTGFIKNNPHY